MNGELARDQGHLGQGHLGQDHLDQGHLGQGRSHSGQGGPSPGSPGVGRSATNVCRAASFRQAARLLTTGDAWHT